MLTFTQLQELLSYVTKPSQPHRFYRTHYHMKDGEGPRTARTLEEWQSLPPVTKDDLIASPLHERSFLPLRELDHLRTSSGSSGKPPLFSPRTLVKNMDYRMAYHDFTRPCMAFLIPMMPHWHERFLRAHGKPGQVLVYDPKNPLASALLARNAGVDALSLFVFQVQHAGEAFKKAGANGAIRLVEVAGEICSRALYDYMRATFPNATLVQSYGSSEVEDVHIGMPCKPMDGSDPLAVYHPKETHFLEIIGPDSDRPIEPTAGAEGDLLITAYSGEPTSFPLLRFRIGDTVRVVEDACPHGSWSFTVLGRTDMDFIKISGGILRADEMARVLRLFPEDVTDLFELHCTMEETARGPLVKPVLHVQEKKSLDMSTFARTVAEHLRTGPSQTYAEGMALGRYLPLTCVPLTTRTGLKKHRRVCWD